VLLLFTASCISSINQENVDRIKDAGAPTIIIQSPSEGSYYSELVTIEGIVADDSGESEGAGEIKSLSYEIKGPLGVIVKADLSYENDGSFSFQFPTANMDGSAVVTITAVDWNGNTCEASVTLKDPGNDIPSFTATSGNGEVDLRWSTVPGNVGYRV